MKKFLSSVVLSLALLLAGVPAQAVNSWQGVSPDSGETGFTLSLLDSNPDFYFLRMDLEPVFLSALDTPDGSVPVNSFGVTLDRMGSWISYGAEFIGKENGTNLFRADSTDYGFSSGNSFLQWEFRKTPGDSFLLDAFAFVDADYYETGVVAPTPTPIPGAVWLMASGLVGLIGLRRRNG